jgi:dTDP-4-amino-4,6-dideoxygalactose transaminase
MLGNVSLATSGKEPPVALGPAGGRCFFSYPSKSYAWVRLVTLDTGCDKFCELSEWNTMSREQHQVPFFNFPGLYKQHRAKYLEIIDEVCSRGGFILQRDVDEFETKLARYVGVKHAIGLSDCTNAMLLGLRALGIGNADEVIFPSHTFIATAQAIHYAGAVPIPVDMSDDGLIDASSAEAAITERTKAIMVVQLNGRIAEMRELERLAGKYSLELVEDAAQGLGATYHGKHAGSFGRFGAFSFYPSKPIGTFGDAGALTTNDDELAAKVRSMRNHGVDAQKVIKAWGTNSRLDNLHAAILSYKIDCFGEDIERRRSIASRYHQAFSSISDFRLPPGPDQEPNRFDIFLNYELQTSRRDELKKYLAERGVGTLIQWGGVPVHHMHFLGFRQRLPATDLFFKRCIMLPMHQMLSDDDVDYVIACVQEFFSR